LEAEIIDKGHLGLISRLTLGFIAKKNIGSASKILIDLINWTPLYIRLRDYFYFIFTIRLFSRSRSKGYGLKYKIIY
jgi:hypothetical protein